MELSAKPASVQEISLWRDLYRQEMNGQIVLDSAHSRGGWTQPYLFEVGGQPAGYGCILIGGPWTGTRTVFEFYVMPKHRSRAFDLFGTLLGAAEATAIEVQSNDILLSVMLHAWAKDIRCGSIVFADKLTTAHSVDDGLFYRRAGWRMGPRSRWHGCSKRRHSLSLQSPLWRYIHGSPGAIAASRLWILFGPGIKAGLLRTGEYSLRPMQPAECSFPQNTSKSGLCALREHSERRALTALLEATGVLLLTKVHDQPTRTLTQPLPTKSWSARQIPEWNPPSTGWSRDPD
jgi:hypothetical protein